MLGRKAGFAVYNIRYNIIINRGIIADRMSADIPRGSADFDAVKQMIAQRTEDLADDYLRMEMIRTGRKPSQVCPKMPGPSSIPNGNTAAMTETDHCRAFIDWATKSGLMMPKYRSDIRTLADIITAEDLPLIYVWTPENAGDNVSISVNGHVVAQYLQTQFPASRRSSMRCPTLWLHKYNWHRPHGGIKPQSAASG